MLSFRTRVDQGAMAMKGCSACSKPPALLEPHYLIVKCYIQDTRWGLNPLKRCSRYILQTQLTGPLVEGWSFSVEMQTVYSTALHPADLAMLALCPNHLIPQTSVFFTFYSICAALCYILLSFHILFLNTFFWLKFNLNRNYLFSVFQSVNHESLPEDSF